MYALYRGQTGIQIQQDDIYDQGKSTGGEIAGNGIIETVALGMYDQGPAARQLTAGWRLTTPRISPTQSFDVV